jgi:hypothetical protein
MNYGEAEMMSSAGETMMHGGSRAGKKKERTAARGA